ARLGAELNKTYIAYGAAGEKGAGRQAAQDANAVAAAPSANVQRQVAKAGFAYSNSSWDLVDAKKEGTVDLDKVNPKDLPAEMQKMTPAERKAYVETKEKTRSDIQARIKKLDAERTKYIADEMKKQKPTSTTLDAAVIGAARSIGTKKGYKFE